jgi:hypothetical protein
MTPLSLSAAEKTILRGNRLLTRAAQFEPPTWTVGFSPREALASLAKERR